MPDTARRLAVRRLEVPCARLKNAALPAPHLPPLTQEDLLAALDIMLKAIDEIE